MARAPGQTRRVYMLPDDMLKRIHRFQASKGLANEVDAVRQLLSEALQHREQIDDILDRLSASFDKIKDLRELAKLHLIDHARVTSIELSPREILFHMDNFSKGRFMKDGKSFIETSPDRWEEYDYIPF